MGDVLQSLIVLSDLKASYPSYTFGIILDFRHKTTNIPRERMLEETIRSLATRFSKSNVAFITSDQSDVENYLEIKGLLKRRPEK